jgi:hypothetical protein
MVVERKGNVPNLSFRKLTGVITPADIVRDASRQVKRISPQYAIQLRIIARDVERRDLGPLATANLIKRQMDPTRLDGELRTCVERLIRTLKRF